MKIAICIRGELRTWFSAKDNIFDTFKDLDPDYFFTTWSENYNQEEDKIIPVIDQEIIDSFENHNLKSLKILNLHVPETRMDVITYVSSKQWFECNQLRKQFEMKNNIEYDYVIAIRPDVIYNSIIKKEYLNNFGDAFMVESSGYVTANPIFLGLFFPDLIFCGRSFVIDIISDYHLYMLKKESENMNYIFDTTHNTFTDYLLENKIVLSSRVFGDFFGHILRFGVDYNGEPITPEIIEKVAKKNSKQFSDGLYQKSYNNLIKRK